MVFSILFVVSHPSVTRPGLYRDPLSPGRGCRRTTEAAVLLGLVDVFAIVAPLRDQGVQDERGFGERECVDVLELAQVERRGRLLVAGRGRLGARGPGVV